MCVLCWAIGATRSQVSSVSHISSETGRMGRTLVSVVFRKTCLSIWTPGPSWWCCLEGQEVWPCWREHSLSQWAPLRGHSSSCFQPLSLLPVSAWWCERTAFCSNCLLPCLPAMMDSHLSGTVSQITLPSINCLGHSAYKNKNITNTVSIFRLWHYFGNWQDRIKWT